MHPKAGAAFFTDSSSVPIQGSAVTPHIQLNITISSHEGYGGGVADASALVECPFALLEWRAEGRGSSDSCPSLPKHREVPCSCPQQQGVGCGKREGGKENRHKLFLQKWWEHDGCVRHVTEASLSWTPFPPKLYPKNPFCLVLYL